ncbi:ribosomal protein S18-alanine N-acetyltransferase [Methanocaldococcus infernus]|uniref:Ribosomal-protein-alanine acetyltransferase n=1 Tax=Methanocaldococcus infernus (strain DSM 11812 / JCM 15783 / ME) TaxID=573063 RepID=D5VTL0_METIM|nr:ribosomal protein S18-alanine N-acetyltransferase [Methanocaldococcus infernus]ADG13913.1 ribosomal-protein-alanine acetyltransferase [Methanocaldococcus infernus ME]
MVLIRRFKSEDIDEVEEIEREAFRKPYPRNLILGLWAMYPNLFYVAELNGRVVGYILGTLDWGNGHIVSLAVKKEFRRRGIGEKLLKTLEHYYFNVLKCNYIILEVRVSNIVARKFYYKMGYKDRKLIPNYYEDGEDAILMIKKREGAKGILVVSLW